MSETVSTTTAGDETNGATTSGAGATAVEAVAAARRTFDRGVTKPREWRVAQLRALRSLLVDHEDEIAEALHDDLGKSATESWITETGFVVREIDHTLRHLRAWTSPRRVAGAALARPRPGHARARAARRRPGHRAVELPRPALPRPARRRARRRERRRPQAERGRPRHVCASSRACSRSTSMPPRCTSSRAGSRRRRHCSPSGSTTSSTPATGPSAGSCSRPRRAT